MIVSEGSKVAFADRGAGDLLHHPDLDSIAMASVLLAALLGVSLVVGF